MAVMTEKRVRYLPVIDEGKLIGYLIGDLVKNIISNHQFTIDQLDPLFARLGAQNTQGRKGGRCGTVILRPWCKPDDKADA